MDPFTGTITGCQAAVYLLTTIRVLLDFCNYIKHGNKIIREYCGSIADLYYVIQRLGDKETSVTPALKQLLGSIHVTIENLLRLFRPARRLSAGFILFVRRTTLNESFGILERQKTTLLIYLTTELSITSAQNLSQISSRADTMDLEEKSIQDRPLTPPSTPYLGHLEHRETILIAQDTSLLELPTSSTDQDNTEEYKPTNPQNSSSANLLHGLRIGPGGEHIISTSEGSMQHGIDIAQDNEVATFGHILGGYGGQTTGELADVHANRASLIVRLVSMSSNEKISNQRNCPSQTPEKSMADITIKNTRVEAGATWSHRPCARNGVRNPSLLVANNNVGRFGTQHCISDETASVKVAKARNKALAALGKALLSLDSN